MTLALMLLGGCSTVMEYNRPAPTSLDGITLGQQRIDIISHIGVPTTSVKNGDDSCDVYKLFTKGPTGAAKGAVILGEGAADFFTLGLAELALTPAEAATKSHPHTVLFCYSPDEKLVSLRDEGGKAIRMDSPGVAGSPPHS